MTTSPTLRRSCPRRPDDIGKTKIVTSLRVSLIALPQKQPNSPVALVQAWCVFLLRWG